MPGYWFRSFVAFLSTATSSLSVETQKQKKNKKEDLGDMNPAIAVDLTLVNNAYMLQVFTSRDG